MKRKRQIRKGRRGWVWSKSMIYLHENVSVKLITMCARINGCLVHQIPRLTNVMAHVLRSSLSQKETTMSQEDYLALSAREKNFFQIRHPSLLVHRHHGCLSFVCLPWSTSALLLNSLTLHLEWYWILSTLSKRNLSSSAHCAAAPTSLSSQLHDMGAGSRPGHLPQPKVNRSREATSCCEKVHEAFQ